MIIKGITRRWLLNGMGVIFAILAVIWIFCALAVRSYYYNSVLQNLMYKARSNSNNFPTLLSAQSSDYYATAKRLVEGSLDKDKLELMMLNSQGTVLITSSGFMPESNAMPPDYALALKSSNGIGEWDGYDSETGEKIMAVTSILRDSGGSRVGAARYVVSLTRVDMQIATFILISGLLGVAVILFVIMSGTYFVNSIVVPVRQIGATARRIASGDLDVRINKRYDDEIGELCDTINFMASELQSTEQMKNDFISSVSHELRTPLTAIRGWGETILSSGPSDRETLVKGMGVIIEETERLSTMVEELLDFSRMQSKRFKLALDKIDVLAELGEAVLMFSDRAKREGIQLVFHEPESLPAVMGDKNKLKQVFVNILDNALKYSDPGGTITIDAERREQNIVVSVSDTGNGISTADLPHVKERFYKGHSTRRGTGIGLAVCDEIITQHGGRLDIESKEGAGTKVSILLPVYAG